MLLDRLAQHDVLATFFIVGQIAISNPKLVRDIHAAGHEVASHSRNHEAVYHFTPAGFAEDVRRSRDALEQATGTAVRGFRALMFSILRQNGWAIDILAGMGFAYDSSIFPVRHDRYGIPAARCARRSWPWGGGAQRIIELPPATLRHTFASIFPSAAAAISASFH